VTSKVKGQCYNATSSVRCLFAHNSIKKSRINTLSVPRLTFRITSKVKMSKVKVTRPLNAVTKNQLYLWNGNACKLPSTGHNVGARNTGRTACCAYTLALSNVSIMISSPTLHSHVTCQRPDNGFFAQ